MLPTAVALVIALALIGVGIWLAVEADRHAIPTPTAVQGTVLSVENEHEDWRSKRTGSRRYTGRELGRLFSSSGSYLHCGEPTGVSAEGFDVRSCETRHRRRKRRATSWKYPQVKQSVVVRVAGRSDPAELEAWVPFLPTAGAAARRPGTLVAGDAVTLHYDPNDAEKLFWHADDVRGKAKFKKSQLIAGAVVCTMVGVLLGAAAREMHRAL